jgi:hypothetical protein
MFERRHAEQEESVIEAIDLGPMDILFLRLLLESKSEPESENPEHPEQPESHNTRFF